MIGLRPLGTAPLGTYGTIAAPPVPPTSPVVYDTAIQVVGIDWSVGATFDGHSFGAVDDPLALVVNAPQSGLYVWALESLMGDATVTADEAPTANGLRNMGGTWFDGLLPRGPYDNRTPSPGSRVWLYDHVGFTAKDVQEIEGRISEALAWMVEGGLADFVNVSCAADRVNIGRVSCSIEITKDGKTLSFRHPDVLAAWEVAR